jgi:hypothetical protein
MICRNVLLSISFVARRDDFIVGQVGNLRPIVNRPAGSAHSAEGSPSPLATCRYVGQAILPAAAFQAALCLAPNLARGSRRVSEPHE